MLAWRMHKSSSVGFAEVQNVCGIIWHRSWDMSEGGLEE